MSNQELNTALYQKTDHMENICNTVECRADTLLHQKKQKTQQER